MPLLTALPLEIITHISIFLGCYPTTDVISLLSICKLTNSWSNNSDLIFLVLKSQLLHHKKYYGAKLTGKIHIQKKIKSSARRTSKRLKVGGLTILKNAITLLKQNSERAHDDLCGISPSLSKCNTLSAANFVKILKKWMPLDANTIHPRGSTLLMEVIRMRHATESQTFRCVKNLLANWGVNPNISHPNSNLSPLIIASARGYAKVVELLINVGCNMTQKGTGTFFSSSTSDDGSHVKLKHFGTHSAIGWVRVMMDLERRNGATSQQISDLVTCYKLLYNAMQKNEIESAT